MLFQLRAGQDDVELGKRRNPSTMLELDSVLDTRKGRESVPALRDLWAPLQQMRREKEEEMRRDHPLPEFAGVVPTTSAGNRFPARRRSADGQEA